MKMKKKKPVVRENSFDGSPGGMSGTINYSTGWATHASPGNTQYPDRFYQSQGKNTAANQSGGPSGGVDLTADAPTQDKLNKDVDKIFQKTDTPTPDEVAAGLQFEMGHMINRDKGRAKEKVLNNLKKDPHFYSNLHMLNIDDKKMKVDEVVRSTNKSELRKIFKEIAEDRSRVFETKPEIASVMQDLWRRKEERNLWKQGKTSQAPND